MAIPYDIATGTVLALNAENPRGVRPTDVRPGTRHLAPIYNPRGYVKHWPATVLAGGQDKPDGERVIVAYDDSHGVGNYGPIRRGDVFVVDLIRLTEPATDEDDAELAAPSGEPGKQPVLAERPANWDQMTRQEKLAWADRFVQLMKRG